MVMVKVFDGVQFMYNNSNVMFPKEKILQKHCWRTFLVLHCWEEYEEIYSTYKYFLAFDLPQLDLWDQASTKKQNGIFR